MYGWIFYDVETIDKNTEEFIKNENYMNIEEAEEYIKRMIDTKSLDYNEKLVLVKRYYDNNRDLIEEEIIKEVHYEKQN